MHRVRQEGTGQFVEGLPVRQASLEINLQAAAVWYRSSGTWQEASRRSPIGSLNLFPSTFPAAWLSCDVAMDPLDGIGGGEGQHACEHLVKRDS